MKIALGTVQFGLNYGISNTEGQTPPSEVARILQVARDEGITTLDTAASYGNSEQVLGAVLQADHPFQVVTKTIRIDSEKVTAADADLVEQGLVASLAKLRCNSVYGVMFHNADDLLATGGDRLMERLLRCKLEGRLQKVGVSVYTADQICRILERFEIDLIQVPMNVLDQRLLSGGQLTALKDRGVEIHVRSAFLQGLLLMQPESIPPFFAPVRNRLEEFHRLALDRGLTPVSAALGFLASRPEIDSIVCGVNNHEQLVELCRSAQPLTDIDFAPFACQDATILDPSQWKVC